MKELFIGQKDNQAVNLSLSTLRTHCAILGSSGCGKTVALKVLIEELSINNIPTIAVDPHGDISSLIYNEEDIEALHSKGISDKHINSFQNNTEVMIWTPGSDKGLPLCINPLQFDDMPNNIEDRIQYLSHSAQTLAYALDYDDKKQRTVYSALQIIFQYYTECNVDISDFTKLINHLESIPDNLLSNLKKVGFDLKDIKELKQQLYQFTVGAESLLFDNGIPLDIDLLLGKKNNKTHISIIYLNSIINDNKKDFFISVLNQKIFYWMKQQTAINDNNKLQCAYLIDEISPWIPPVKKTLCKESFERLFKESRKFGVSLIIATQSPGDIDYKIISQVSTTLLGKIQMKQEIEKVKNKIESKNQIAIKDIIKSLPSLETGTFFLISKEYDEVMKINIRWLLTKHGIDKDGKNWLVNLNDLGNLMKDTKNILMPKSKKIIFQKSKPSHNSSSNNNLVDDDIVWLIKNQIFERDVARKVRKYLDGNLIFKHEKIIKTKFKYLSIIRVECSFIKKVGLFKKNKKEISDINLYFKRYSINNEIEYKILSFYKNIKFDSILDKDPNVIQDLDDKCILIQKKRSELKNEFDFRSAVEMKKVKKDVMKIIQKKYDVNIHNIYLTLLPTWQCEVINRKSNSKRLIEIDAIYGKKIDY
tara:strand:- start:7987 stop:9930 length:1944 start_codon:yes stop_codon:yes gene_type:complete